MNRCTREDVWLALSDLFLDTDVSMQRDNIVRILMAAPFDLATLDKIFIEEVYPVCISNLHDIAGEWAGFPKDWLVARVSKQQGRRIWFGRLVIWRRWRHARAVVPEWFQIRAALEDQGKR